jgi:hypothetical protein
VDVLARRLRPALLTRVRADVGHPQRGAILPDLARQPLALGERRMARGQREADQRRARHMPEVNAADHLLVGVDPPQRPHLPVEPPADDLEQARRSLRKRLRFGECARHRQVRPQTLLYHVVTALSVAFGVASVPHQIPRQPA